MQNDKERVKIQVKKKKKKKPPVEILGRSVEVFRLLEVRILPLSLLILVLSHNEIDNTGYLHNASI